MTIPDVKCSIVVAQTIAIALTVLSCRVNDSITVPEAISAPQSEDGANEQAEPSTRDELPIPGANQPAITPSNPGVQEAISGTVANPIPSPSPSPTVPLESPTIAEGNYLIKSLASGRCLDIPGSNKSPGIQVQIFSCNNSSAQLWNIAHVSDNFYKITNPNGRSLEVRDGLLANTSPLQTGDFSSLDTQQFRFEKDNESFRIFAKNSEFAVDIANFGIVDRSKIEMYLREAADTQKWNLVFVP